MISCGGLSLCTSMSIWAGHPISVARDPIQQSAELTSIHPTFLERVDGLTGKVCTLAELAGRVRQSQVDAVISLSTRRAKDLCGGRTFKPRRSPLCSFTHKRCRYVGRVPVCQDVADNQAHFAYFCKALKATTFAVKLRVTGCSRRCP